MRLYRFPVSYTHLDVYKRQLLRQDKAGSWLAISIHEGRKRQVRRMCAAIGHPVLSLRRIAFGVLKLGDLPEGQWLSLIHIWIGTSG